VLTDRPVIRVKPDPDVQILALSFMNASITRSCWRAKLLKWGCEKFDVLQVVVSGPRSRTNAPFLMAKCYTAGTDPKDENGLGFAWLGQYDAYERSNLDGGSHSELSGTMVGAKRINEQVRVGGFLSWQFDSDDY
jgi:hypothetical protein